MYTCVYRVYRVVGGGGGGGGNDNGGIPMSVTTFRTGPGQLRGDRFAATPKTRTTWTSRTGRGPGTASSDHRTHESTRCLASSVRFVQRPTRYYLSPLRICLSRSPYAPSIAAAFAPSPSDRDPRASREDVERELFSGSRSLNATVTSRAAILSKFAREKERQRVSSRLSLRN